MSENNLVIKGELLEIYLSLAKIGPLLFQKGWAERNGGNISIRLHSSPRDWGLTKESIWEKIPLSRNYENLLGDYILLKGSGKKFRDFSSPPTLNFCIGKITDNSLDIIWPPNCSFQPTSELESHLIIQNQNREVAPNHRAILHTHPTELIALSLLPSLQNTKALNDVLLRIMPETSIFLSDSIGFLPFQENDEHQKTAIETGKLMKKHRLVLWENHGIIATEVTFEECFDLIDIANKAAKIYLLTAPLKENPKLFTDQQLQTIKDKYLPKK